VYSVLCRITLFESQLSSTIQSTTTAEAKLAEAAAQFPFSFEEEELISQGNSRDRNSRNNSKSGASSVSSGVRLEHISKTFKGQQVLKDVSWEVKKGEKVGLVGVNGAGKTTQLRIIAGIEDADSGSVIKMRNNMKIAFLTQEFEIVPSRTVREEFQSAFAEQMAICGKIERVQKALETATDDMDLFFLLHI
jgi:ABC-type molybdenum transport system ATPase subunit/photorepair protein PhrA